MHRRSLLAGGAAVLAPRVSVAGPATSGPAFDAAFAYSAESGGDAMVVLQDGRVAYERYGPGRSPDALNSIASATKSFWGPATAILIGEGVFSGWDEPASETLTEWRSDPVRSRITLRHLLSLTSGLEGDTDALQGQGSATNKYLTAVQATAGQTPGSSFKYGPVNYYVFGEIVRRKLAGRYADPLAFLDERILKPVGLRHYQWLRDPAGNPHIPNGCSLRARDWARFGQMVLQGGVLDGRRLVPEAPLRDCFRPAPANPAYGLTFWLNAPGGSVLGKRAPPGSPAGGLYPKGEAGMAAALGAGRNGLYLIPSRKMVVVRQRPYQERQPGMTFAEHVRRMRAWEGNFDDQRFLELLLA